MFSPRQEIDGMPYARVLQTIDCHAAGGAAPHRDWRPSPVPGETILARRRYMRERPDHVRPAGFHTFVLDPHEPLPEGFLLR